MEINQELQGTATAENLRAALKGESLARNRYSFFAMAAREAGDDQAAAALERMMKNEMMHAKFWFEALYGARADTLSNLQEAASGEFEEWHAMYPAFARQAREEGLEELARQFDQVAAIEKDHERQFMELCQEIVRTRRGQTPAQSAVQTERSGYRCQFCGAVYAARPDVCTVCHAIGAFEACTYQA